MSELDSPYGDLSDVEGFDVSAVARGVACPPVIDERGRSHFLWPSGELTIAPTGRTVRRCDVAMVDRRRQMVDRRLDLETEGAVILAKSMRRLALYREETDGSDEERSSQADRLSAMIDEFPFDEPGELRVARDDLHDLGLYAADERMVRAAIGDVLHPLSLERQFRLANVGTIPADEEAREGVTLRYPDGDSIACTRSLQDDSVVVCIKPLEVDRPEEFPRLLLEPPSALLLFAVSEGLAYLAVAEKQFTEIVPEAIVDMRAKLLELRRAVIDGVDPVLGYRRLTGLFDRGGSPGTAIGESLAQLNAIATMAMLKWMARRGRRALGWRIDVSRVIGATRYEPALSDDEYSLRCGSGELVFRLDGDLVVGRGRLIGAEGQLLSTPIAFPALTLELVAWALAGIDGIDGEASLALIDYVRRALLQPLFDVRVETAPLLQTLVEVANRRGRKHRASAAAARALLERRPRGNGPR